MSGIKELIKSNRSYRRFSDAKIPTEEELVCMIDSARFCASAGNLQRLKFTPVSDKALCDGVFEKLAFAAYFGNWRPAESERPTAYIVFWAENEPDVNLAIDAGIAAEAILLTAREMGFGGCLFRSIKKQELTEFLKKDGYVPVLVAALGLPSETVVLTDVRDGNVKYYRDGDVHCVPKRKLSDVLI